jgi:hypothetical protein
MRVRSDMRVSMRDRRMRSARQARSEDGPRRCADERGQAAVEFVFFFLSVVMMLMFIMTMFFFAQDFFQGITQARYDSLVKFRATDPYEVDADTAYVEVIRVRLRRFPFMGRFIQGIAPVTKRTRLVGGAEPPYTISGPVECGAALALVGTQAGTSNDTGPGAWAGAGIGAAACEVYALW